MSFLKEFFNSMARVLGRIIVYIILAFIMFYIINDKVNAKSYTWNSPYILDIQNVLNDTDDVMARCRNTNTCEYNSSLWGGNYGMARYNVSTNINNEDTTIESNTYKLEFSSELWTVGDSTIPTLTSTSRLLFYTGTGTGMSRATCDGGENYTLNLTNEVGIYQFNYTCNEFLVNRNDISYFAIVFGSSSNLFYKVSILNNLKFIGPGEATNDDVINNQDKNTQNIINNQNQNQQQTNEGLQDIEDAILDNSQPNLDNFNYTDSTGGLISTFLTMPITLLRVMNNVETCRSITLGNLFGTPLRFDCINPRSFLGDTLWNIIDYFIVFNMITSISQLFVYVYEKFKNLDDFFNEFYTPQHMAPDGYVPRHGGGK